MHLGQHLWFCSFIFPLISQLEPLCFQNKLPAILALTTRGSQSFSWFYKTVQFSSVQSLSRVWLFVSPWTAACQTSLSITNSWSSLKLMSIESVMPSSHLILCHPLLLPSIFPHIRVFSNESAPRIRWLKYWSLSFTSVLPMNTQDWSPLGWTDWISL